MPSQPTDNVHLTASVGNAPVGFFECRVFWRPRENPQAQNCRFFDPRLAYPAGDGSARILRRMLPKIRRVRWLSASSSQQYRARLIKRPLSKPHEYWRSLRSRLLQLFQLFCINRTNFAPKQTPKTPNQKRRDGDQSQARFPGSDVRATIEKPTPVECGRAATVKTIAIIRI